MLAHAHFRLNFEMSESFEFSAALGTNIVTVLDYFGGFTHPHLQTTHSEKKEEVSLQSNNSTCVFIEAVFQIFR